MPLKTRKPLKRKTPLRRKHNQATTEYLARRIRYLAQHTKCLSYQYPLPYECLSQCTDKATQVHHKMRRGKFLNDESTWMPICASCHRWIETHANIARECGLLPVKRDGVETLLIDHG